MCVREREARREGGREGGREAEGEGERENALKLSLSLEIQYSDTYNIHRGYESLDAPNHGKVQGKVF